MLSALAGSTVHGMWVYWLLRMNEHITYVILPSTYAVDQSACDCNESCLWITTFQLWTLSKQLTISVP